VNKPMSQFFIAVDGCTVWAEQIDAEVFELLSGRFYVVQDTFTRIPFCSDEQTYPLKILGNVFGSDGRGDSFVPQIA